MINAFENYIFCENTIYKLVRANNNIDFLYSLKNIVNNKFLRHINSRVIETYKNKTDPFFNDDSSFFIVKKGSNIHLRCSNENLNDFFISKKNDVFEISKENPFCFKLAKQLELNTFIRINEGIYISCPSNNGQLGCCSLKLVNTNLFLRHKDGKILTSRKESNTIFDDDSSFICFTNSNYVVIFCSNTNLQGYYISKDTLSDACIANNGKYEFFEIVATHSSVNKLIKNESINICDDFNTQFKTLMKTIERQNNIIQNLENRFVSSKEIVFDYLKARTSEKISEKPTGTNKNIYISVIVPVFNMEKYIKECLDSIINQNLEDIEIIIVDDGSTDFSYNIIEEYAKLDSRINILKQTNQGAGASRNLGINVATGEYVCFIDPDDIYPYNDILKNMYTCARLFNAKIVGGEFSIFSDQSQILSQDFQKGYEGYKFKNSGMLRYEDYQFDYGFHRFIYSRKFLNDEKIYFPNYKRFQDPPFFVKSLHNARDFFAINSITYGYRVNHKQTKWTHESIDDFIQGISDIISFAVYHNYPKLQLYSFYHLYDHFKEIQKYSSPEINLKFLQTIELFDKNNTELDSKLKAFCRLILSQEPAENPSSIPKH